MRKLMLILAVLLWSNFGFAAENNADTTHKVVFRIKIMDDIMPAAWRTTQKGFAEAKEKNADIILIHMNTYGGMVNIADSIRTKILNSPIPVWMFVDNQAASAGALISIACDSIYMRKGGSIGAATVVDQSGNVVPDKFQSFMRSTMRATAEAKGKDTLIVNGDTTTKWRRDPHIAEAMVDPAVFISGIIDSGKVLTFTTEEAILNGYCEGKAESVQEVLSIAGVENYTLHDLHFTFVDRVIGFLINPIVSGILIMLIIGGLYYELQSPGIGFPLAVALIAATAYLAPHYLEGLAEHWEILIFIAGVVLIGLEVFVIPGFGIAGISGIALTIIGLALAMLDNQLFKGVGPLPWVYILRPFVVVTLALFFGLVGSILLSKKLLTSSAFPNLALNTNLSGAEGYIGIDQHQKEMVGKMGIALTVLRPSGKVSIGDEVFDAMSDEGFINKGEKVIVTKDEAGQLYVSRIV